MSDSGAMIGDEVRIFLSSGESLNATVKHIPQASGDSWIVWGNDGTIHHIQEFESLYVLNRKATTDRTTEKEGNGDKCQG